MDSMKHEVVQFVEEFYERNRRAPTFREILKHFKSRGLSSSAFYQLFPNGLGELCKLAGIPIPEERMQKTARAKAALREGRRIPQETVSSRLTLTEEQTRRLLGISHLERGEDPLLIIDELLDNDAVLRREFKLTLKDIAQVAVFLKYAFSISWRIGQNPDLLSCLTKAWNIGLLDFEPQVILNLIEVLEEAQEKGWKPAEFVNYVTRFQNEIQAYNMFQRGLISFEEFRKRVEPILQT
ncbi:MAG: TusE/DsrC/DsvC family sulfur relay protein [Thermoproteota archaeon]